MKVDAILYVEDHLTDGALSFEGAFVPESLASRLAASEKITGVCYSLPVSYTGKLSGAPRAFTRTDRDDISFWKRLIGETQSDHVIKIHADSPFMDLAVIHDMIDLHLKYLAEFTYSENLPAGISCEIISKELIGSIPESGDPMMPLGEVVRSNINRFDVELYYREPDIRDKRISFRSGDVRERIIMENIRSVLGRIPVYSELRETINANPQVLFVGPSYAEIEISGRCDLDCIFCYRKALNAPHGDMDTELFRKILSDLSGFGLPWSISLSGSGEPMMHGKFYEILGHCLEQPGLNSLVIETNGVHADGNFRNFMLQAKDPRIRLIVNINGIDADSYTRIHGADHYETVTGNVLSLREAFNEKESLFVQIMKINETEPFLDRYYDFWEKSGVPIILQKQNTYLGRIEDRRYSDLSPLDRGPCWHLQRDLSILWDGTIAYCRQDIDGGVPRGNVQTQSLKEIWDKSLSLFLQDYRGDFPRTPDCASCDEWYTFNL